MMSERSGVGDGGGVDEPAKRHKQRRHRKHKRGSSRRRDSDQRGANGGDTAHSASNQVAQHVVRDTPRASVTAPGLAPPPPPHVDVTGATGTRQGIVVVVVLVCVTALGVASWTMKGSRVAMVAVEGHAGVGHSGGVPAHKLSPDTVAGQWNQHEHKWRPLPNPAVDCPGPVRKRYGTVDEDEWLGVIGTLMAENPGIARFYSQVPASSRICVRVAGASAHIACAQWLPPVVAGRGRYVSHAPVLWAPSGGRRRVHRRGRHGWQDAQQHGGARGGHGLGGHLHRAVAPQLCAAEAQATVLRQLQCRHMQGARQDGRVRRGASAPVCTPRACAAVGV